MRISGLEPDEKRGCRPPELEWSGVGLYDGDIIAVTQS